MKEIRISVVKYTNSAPFIYGLENHPLRDSVRLSHDTPADCYEKLLHDKTDLGLVPVVILNRLDYSDIVSPYCIGARGKVRSVILASHERLKDIRKIYLDYQSRTSVTLVQILAKKFWKITPEFVPACEGFETMKLEKGEALVVIGDRAFDFHDADYRIYDLGEEWYRHTGKPFVFACWIANKPIDPAFKPIFAEALQMGLDHRDELAGRLQPRFDAHRVDIKNYFFENINYNFGPADEEGMNLFLNLMRLILNR
ncbi:MAG TPA: menaquinone biosynthesis protein [Bacteroidales bacterium]|nr:menaquinone biosynthesis protein [Bacteroidales bacterium]